MSENFQLFYGLSEEEIRTLPCTVKNFSKGRIVVREGESAKYFGLVKTGEVEISTTDWNGNKNILMTLKPGQVFGEAICVLGDEKYPVSVTALVDSSICFINANVLKNNCNQVFMMNLMKIMALNSIEFRKKLTLLSRQTTREKLLAYLNLERTANGSNSFTIPFDRQALADYLGVERSAMSAEIGKLVKEGLISTSRSRFSVLWK